MKNYNLKIIFIFVVLMMPLFADAQTYEVYKSNGKVEVFNYNEVDSIVFRAKKNLPSAQELQQTWEAAGSIFDLNSNGVCYQLDYNSDDGFAHIPNGDYVTISIREYCEQFAKDWNADSNNER